MKIRKLLPVLALALVAPGLAGSESPTPCSEEWNRFVEQKIISGDGQGHGPDLGSDEWKGVVEFKLGIRGQAGLPPRDSDDWCQLIDRLVRER